jgi:hypothetical protein
VSRTVPTAASSGTRGCTSTVVSTATPSSVSRPENRSGLVVTRPVAVAHRSVENAASIRVHDDGDVLRVLDGDRGVFATTDSVDVDGFEETAVTIRTLLG